MSGIGETGSISMSGRCPSCSLVNCELYCEFRASATSVGSLKRLPFNLRTGILLWPDFFCFNNNNNNNNSLYFQRVTHLAKKKLIFHEALEFFFYV